jgi:hypothetical protein
MAHAYYRYIRWTITGRKAGTQGNVQASALELMSSSVFRPAGLAEKDDGDR